MEALRDQRGLRWLDELAGDPLTIAAVVAPIVIVAAIACWLPAHRASRLDPNLVLKAE
jgi:ABC-type lipoprotein release transport system permease subunit